MSGGRATLRNRGTGPKNVTQIGDVSAIDPRGNALTDKFIVECKSWRNLQIETSFLFRKGRLFKFWNRLIIDCNTHDRLPLLIAKQNNLPEILMITTEKGSEVLGISPRHCLLTLPRWVALNGRHAAVVHRFSILERISCPL